MRDLIYMQDEIIKSFMPNKHFELFDSEVNKESNIWTIWFKGTQVISITPSNGGFTIRNYEGGTCVYSIFRNERHQVLVLVSRTLKHILNKCRNPFFRKFGKV